MNFHILEIIFVVGIGLVLFHDTQQADKFNRNMSTKQFLEPRDLQLQCFRMFLKFRDSPTSRKTQKSRRKIRQLICLRACTLILIQYFDMFWTPFQRDNRHSVLLIMDRLILSIESQAQSVKDYFSKIIQPSGPEDPLDLVNELLYPYLIIVLRQRHGQAAGHERLHGVAGLGVGHGVHGRRLLVDMIVWLVTCCLLLLVVSLQLVMMVSWLQLQLLGVSWPRLHLSWAGHGSSRGQGRPHLLLVRGGRGWGCGGHLARVEHSSCTGSGVAVE